MTPFEGPSVPSGGDAHDPAAHSSGRLGAEEPPPFLGRWGRLYAAVLGWLLLLIVLFAIFTSSFS